MREQVGSKWRGVVLVCGKCTRKVRGGFGKDDRTSLAKALRKLVGGKGRKARLGIVETDCLKLCPKGRVVAIDTSRPDQWLLVKPGTPIDEIAARFGITPGE